MRSFAKGVVILFVVVGTAVSLHHLTNRSSVSSSPAAQKVLLPTNRAVGPVMLELYTPYCPSCSQMAPVIETLAENCAAEGVSVVQYDISTAENEYLVDELDIQAVPTFLFIDETGRETARLVGKQSVGALQSKLSGIGGKACDGRS